MTELVRPALGAPAPAVVLIAADGQTWRLADRRGRHVVLIFHRHIHWLPCAAHTAAVRDRLDELGEATEIALITFTDPENLAAYVERLELPFPVLIDPDRQAYRAFGLGRGSVGRVWGRKMIKRYLELFGTEGLHALRGLRRPTDDTLQLGGDFVIAPDGTLSYGFWGEGPDDRPSVDELINAIAAP